MRKLLVIALGVFMGISGVSANENTDRMLELEKQIAEMSQTLKRLQEEVWVLKQKNTPNADPDQTVSPEEEYGWRDRITLSGQVRFRGYEMNNMWSFDDGQRWDQWNVFRTMGSLKASVAATDDVTAVLQLTNQTFGNGVTGKYGQELDNAGNKFFLDSTYIHVRGLFDLPVDISVGRQNLLYGGGFVLYDGNSQFASTSMYFDGVKASWHPLDRVTLDAFYMQDEENNRDNASNDDISLLGLYITAEDVPLIGKSETYLLNRKDEALGKDIWMLGGRISATLTNGFDYALEGAYQAGNALQGVRQEALGLKFDAGYTFNGFSLRPRIFGGFVFLGGDDPDTAENEGWDVFYGGWGGIYGDLLVWTYVNLAGESNVLNTIYDHDRLSSTTLEATFSNFKMASLGIQAKFLKNLSGSLSWGNLMFNETYPGLSDNFGDYYQTNLKYLYNEKLSFSFYGAIIVSGAAFKDAGQDIASEIYWETDYRF